MRSSARGMTLLEVVIAMGLFAVALTGLLGALGTASSLDSLSRERGFALNAAMTEMEQVMADPYDTLVDTHDGRAFDVNMELASGTSPMLPSEGAASCGQVSVTTFPGNDKLLLIEVQVTWRSVIRQDVSLSLKSLRSEPGETP